MSSWLSSLQGKAENFLEQVDQVAADRLSLTATPGKLQSGDESASTPHATDEGKAVALDSSYLSLLNDAGPEKRRETTRAVSRSTSLGVEAVSRTNGAARTTTSAAAANSTTDASAPSSSSSSSLATGPAVGSAPAAPLSAAESSQLVSENRLLKSEIAALEDEIASFSSRIRASQDALSETKDSLVSARQQLTEATSARAKLTAENAKMRDSLSSKEKDFGSLQATVLALQEQARVATQQRDAVLAEQAKQTDAHAKALHTLQAELAVARGSSSTGEAALATANQQHTNRIRTLEAALTERDKQLRDLSNTLELAKSASRALVCVSECVCVCVCV
jgi:predicted  nucleic acid-binding Zn-ribbon protein